MLDVKCEKENTEKYKEEVYRYLCGENDIFTSEQQYEELCQNMSVNIGVHNWSREHNSNVATA